MIDHKSNGYLAEPGDVHDLAHGIAWILEDRSRRQALSMNARHKVKSEFAIETVARKYIKLFEELHER